MAKKDKAAASANSTAAKIPKQIGGVKVPKKLRKSGNALIAKANSPIGREVLAAGIAAVATAAAASRAKATGKAEPHPGVTPGPHMPPPSGASDVNVDKIVDAVNAVATSFLQKFRDRQG